MNKNIAQNRPVQAKSAIVAKPQGIMVLGMHRSGMSACTRALNLMGCALSDKSSGFTSLGSEDSNETGHWESLDIVVLNDEMLATAGSD